MLAHVLVIILTRADATARREYGYRIEDAMPVSRIMSEQPDTSILNMIARYERNRTKKIDEAFDEAS